MASARDSTVRRAERDKAGGRLDAAAAAPPIAAAHDPIAIVCSLQRTAGNASVARSLAASAPRQRTLARLRSYGKWMSGSDISIGPFRRDRSEALQQVDRAVHDYHQNSSGSAQVRRDKLTAIEQAINNWRSAKGGFAEAEKTARGPRVAELYNEVQADKELVGQELKRERITAFDPDLLAGLGGGTATAAEVFRRFMERFGGGRVRYTLTTAGQRSPWGGGAGPFACGTFASALADLAQVAGLEAKTVRISPQNFVTNEIDDDFIDPSAAGNIQIGGVRQRRYFFSEHYVTRIDGQFFCPTSGKALSSIDAPELVDAAIGEMKSDGLGCYTRGRTTVRRVGDTAGGGGLYELVTA